MYVLGLHEAVDVFDFQHGTFLKRNWGQSETCADVG